MENIHSSDALAEDLIRSFVQVGCAEVHAKTLLEKTLGDMEEGRIEVEDEKVLEASLKKAESLENEIETLAGIRRKMMLKLYEMYDGDKTYWCQVKHLGIGMFTIFEAYEASDRDEDLYQLFLETNKAFVRAVSGFIGSEIVECASCLGDILKSKKGVN